MEKWLAPLAGKVAGKSGRHLWPATFGKVAGTFGRTCTFGGSTFGGSTFGGRKVAGTFGGTFGGRKVAGTFGGRKVAGTFGGKVLEGDVRMALQQAVGESIAEEILFGAERRYEKGVRDGQRKLLKRLLGQRFGTLSPEAITRIEAAASDELEAIGLRAFTATTLEEVLGTPSNERS